MKKYLRKAWIVCTVIITLCFILSCFTSYISPQAFPYTSLFAYAFPLLFVLTAGCGIISFFIQKRLSLFMLLCLVLSYKNLVTSFAFNKPAAWRQQKDANTLRVMTWNVESFVDLSFQTNPKAKTRIAMLNLVHQYNPDIICIQEYKNVENGKRRVAVRKQLDSIGYKYKYESEDVVIEMSGRRVTGGCAFFSKLPLLDSGKAPIRKEVLPESLIYTDVLLNNKPIRIYTAHLASFSLASEASAAELDEGIVLNNYPVEGNFIQKIRDRELEHTHEIDIIKNETVKTPSPFIYCGDLNTTPSSYNYHYLKDSMQDAFLEKGFGIGTTFYKLLPWLRIDVQFADRKLEVRQCMVVKQKLSDHYPVVADYVWK